MLSSTVLMDRVVHVPGLVGGWPLSLCSVVNPPGSSGESPNWANALPPGQRGRLDERMTAPGASSPRRRPSFPEGVPILVDPAAGVTLRATTEADLPAMVEQCRDPETIRWTTTCPRPAGGYQLQRRRGLSRAGSGRLAGRQPATWAVEAERDGARQFCGPVTLRMAEPAGREIGFGLHPEPAAAR